MARKTRSQKERNDSDPVSYGDFSAFKASVESRLAALETEQKWIKESLKELRGKIDVLDNKISDMGESLASKIDRYKWWLLTGLFGGTFTAILLSWIMRVVLLA